MTKTEKAEEWIMGLPILQALQHKPVYLGTANENKVAKRRAKNRMAKQSRKLNRTS